jgi:hypothetical protein
MSEVEIDYDNDNESEVEIDYDNGSNISIPSDFTNENNMSDDDTVYEIENNFGDDNLSVDKNEIDDDNLSVDKNEIDDDNLSVDKNEIDDDNLSVDKNEIDDDNLSVDNVNTYQQSKNIQNIQNILVENNKESTAMYSVLAGLTAAIGLATNSPAALIGSMLLAPIGNIITQLSIINALDSKSDDLAKIAYQRDYLKIIGVNINVFNILNVDNQFNMAFKYSNIQVDGLCVYKNKIYYTSNDIIYIPEVEVSYKTYKISNMKIIIDSSKEEIYAQYVQNVSRSNNDYDNQLKKISFWKILPFVYDYLKSKIEYTKIKDVTGYRTFYINDKVVNSIEYIPISQLRKEIIEHEKSDNPLSFIMNNKKYKFWNVAGWGVVMCLLSVLIGVICGVIFGSIQHTHLVTLNELYERLEKAKPMEKESVQLEINEAISPTRLYFFDLPSKLMTDTSKLENAFGMIVIAICAGFILPNIVKNKDTTRLVGIGIATSLIPPLINLGLYIGLWIFSKFKKDSKLKITEDDILQAMYNSIIIFIINFGILFTMMTNRLKV